MFESKHRIGGSKDLGTEKNGTLTCPRSASEATNEVSESVTTAPLSETLDSADAFCQHKNNTK